MKKKTCAFPGSFNPFHQGHLYIINKALDYGFEKIIVLVSYNENKGPYNIKKVFIEVKKTLNNLNNKKIKIELNCGLTAQYLKRKKIKYIVRGYRNNQDLRYEKNLLNQYQKDYPDLKCILFKSDKKHQDISSSKLTIY